MGQGFGRWRDALALAALAAAGAAQAQGIAARDFAAPLYDAVVPGPLGQDMPYYDFLADQDWPAIRLLAARPLDWSRFGALALPVENLGDTTFRLLLRIDDRPDANGDDRSLTGTITLPPHARGTVLLPLDAGQIGMRARPPVDAPASAEDLPMRQVSGSVDLRHVRALHISGTRSGSERLLRLGNPTLRPRGPTRRDPIVDAFGQAIEDRWPEKVETLADLKAKLRQADELTARLGRDVHPAADRYGGIDPGTGLGGTGFFRVGAVEGRWTLVTPAGHRFFSLGVDAVTSSNPTVTEGRRGLFAWLPEPRDPLIRYLAHEAPGGLQTYDFTQADLARGLGRGWPRLWRERTVARLRSWGFNTLGAWSAPGVTAGAATPFVAMDEVGAGVAAVPMPGGRSLPDPFDPRFAPAADALAARVTAPYRDEAMLLGYFSGNELPWGSPDHPEQGIAAQVLWLGPDSPAKRAMVEGLERRYASPAAFAAAWAVAPPADWAELLARKVAWPSPLTEAARRDVGDFQKLFAARYFDTVAAAIRRHDAHHLYLGTRFADAPPEVVEACARACDVLSFNVYGRSPEARAAAWRPFAKPVLIGEFHFGSTDRGSFWPGMVEVGSEAGRGPAYAAYVADAVEDPQVVGVHWFQYADEPLTGRPYDGENGHIGLVAVTDVPFAGFVADVAAANRRALDAFARLGRLALRGTQ